MHSIPLNLPKINSHSNFKATLYNFTPYLTIIHPPSKGIVFQSIIKIF